MFTEGKMQNAANAGMCCGVHGASVKRTHCSHVQASDDGAYALLCLKQCISNPLAAQYGIGLG